MIRAYIGLAIIGAAMVGVINAGETFQFWHAVWIVYAIFGAVIHLSGILAR